MNEEKFDLCAFVREQILDIIGRMDLLKNNKLPSENQLANKLQVSRSTIRTVLSVLEDEGKVFRRHGSGTYVNPYAFKISTTLYPQVYFTDLIKNSGYTPTIELLDVQVLPAEGNAAARLETAPGEKVVEVRKIYKADGRICIYCIDCMRHSAFTPALLEKLKRENVSIFQFMEQYTDIRVAWDMVYLEATDSLRTPFLHAHLDADDPGPKPFLLVDSINYDAHNTPVLYANSYVNTDIIKYYLVRGRYEGETIDG